jgi:hypothetical protein
VALSSGGRFLLEHVVARNSASETGDTLKTWEDDLRSLRAASGSA